MAFGSGAIRQAPLPGGPTAEVLVDEQAGAGRLAAAHLTILPGGGMAEHAHGDATALLVPLDGEVLIRHGDHEEKVTVGVVVLLDQAERVSLVNQTNEPASLLAVFAPADFVRALGGWPAATEPGARDGG